MPDELRLAHFDEFGKFAANLKEADKALAAKVRKGIRDEAKPVAVEVIKEGARKVPARGGLRAIVEQAAPTVTLTSRGVSLNLYNRRRTNLSALDRGYIRHPVFARASLTRQQWKWVKQMTPQTKNAFTDAFGKVAAPTIAPRILEAVKSSLDDATKGL